MVVLDPFALFFHGILLLAAGVTILFVLILSMLQLGVAAPAFGWVDVVLAAIAGILVARWMPRK